jgi:hypothetical protein
MISGTGQRCLATINGETFAPGETHSVKAGPSRVTVTCVGIGERSVTAKVTGESHPLELKFGEPVPLEGSGTGIHKLIQNLFSRTRSQ